MHINVLERNIKSNTKLFSHDSKESEISTIYLNHNLDVIHQWTHQWKLEFNPGPTKQATEVLFSRKKSSPNHPHIIFNGAVVAIMNDQKHYGLKNLNLKTIK